MLHMTHEDKISQIQTQLQQIATDALYLEADDIEDLLLQVDSLASMTTGYRYSTLAEDIFEFETIDFSIDDRIPA